MKKNATDDSETNSADVIATNIGLLKLLFPKGFTCCKVDFDVLITSTARVSES